MSFMDIKALLKGLRKICHNKRENLISFRKYRSRYLFSYWFFHFDYSAITCILRYLNEFKVVVRLGMYWYDVFLSFWRDFIKNNFYASSLCIALNKLICIMKMVIWIEFEKIRIIGPKWLCFKKIVIMSDGIWVKLWL